MDENLPPITPHNPKKSAGKNVANYLKFIRILLLVLIIIGIGLLLTQKVWVPKLVNKILIYQGFETVSNPETTKEVGDLNPDSFEGCMANGGKDITPNYNAPRKCVLDNRIYEGSCVSNDRYLVIAKNKTDSVGTDILVKYKSSDNQIISCQYLVGSGDFETGGDGAYILALENNFLILDVGTGPDPRGLIIYDLNTRKEVFHDSYSQPVDIQNNTISYWTESSEKATEKNCPELKEWKVGGLGAAIEIHVSLNLSTLVKKELGEYRCSPRQ